ncbi:hypothetical protein Goari_021349, partial [Gossypium aridum]|nr:hypothetical protein [Gossypium aridum]
VGTFLDDPKREWRGPIVQEFYASLRDRESRNTKGCMWDMVLVRGKEVRVTPRIIYDFYNAPYYENYFIDEMI